MPIEFVYSHADAIAIITATATSLSAIAAVAAICFSLFSVSKQLTHNQNAIRPVAVVRYGDYNHKLYIRLRNIGAGPLFIENLKIVSPLKTTHSSLYDAMPDLPGTMEWSDYVQNLDDDVIGVGEDRVLLLLENEDDPDFEKSQELIRTALKDLKISILYKDVYGKQMPTYERDLSWFGRTLSC